MSTHGPLGDRRLNARYNRLPLHEKKRVDRMQAKVDDLRARSLESGVSDPTFAQEATLLEQEIVALLEAPYTSTVTVKTQSVRARTLKKTPEMLKAEGANLRDHLAAGLPPERFSLALARLHEIASELRGGDARDVKRVMYDAIHAQASKISSRSLRYAFRQALLDCYLSREDQVNTLIDRLPATGAKSGDLKAIAKQYPFLSTNERQEAHVKLVKKVGDAAAKPHEPTKQREMATPQSLQALLKAVRKKRREGAALLGDLDHALKSMEEVHLIAIDSLADFVAKQTHLLIVPAHRYLGHIKELIMALPVERRVQACRGARLMCQHHPLLNQALEALEGALEEQAHAYIAMNLEGLKARLGSTGAQGLREALRDPQLLEVFEDTLRQTILSGRPDHELIRLAEHIDGQDVVSGRIGAMCELVHRLEVIPRARSESFADQLTRLQDVFSGRQGAAPNHFVLDNMEGLCALFLGREFPVANMSAHPGYEQVVALFGEPLASIHLHMEARLEAGDHVSAASYSKLSILMGENLKLQANYLKTTALQSLPRETQGLAYEMRLAVAKGLEADLAAMSPDELVAHGRHLIDLQRQVEGLAAFERGLDGLELGVRAILREHFGKELSEEGLFLIETCLKQYYANMEQALREGRSAFSAEAPTELNIDPIAVKFSRLSVPQQTAALVAMQVVSETLHQIHSDGGLIGGRLPVLPADQIDEVIEAKRAQVVSFNRDAARAGRNEKEVAAEVIADAVVAMDAQREKAILDAATAIIATAGEDLDEVGLSIKQLMVRFPGHDEALLLFNVLRPYIMRLPEPLLMVIMDPLIQKSANRVELINFAEGLFKERDPKLTSGALAFFIGRIQDQAAALHAAALQAAAPEEVLSFEELLSLLQNYSSDPMVQAIGKFSERWDLVAHRGEAAVVSLRAPTYHDTSTASGFLLSIIEFLKRIFSSSHAASTGWGAFEKGGGRQALSICYRGVQEALPGMDKAEFLSLARDTFIASTNTPLSLFLNDMLQSKQVKDHPHIQAMYTQLIQLAGQSATERDLQAALDVELTKMISQGFRTREGLQAFADHATILQQRLSRAGAYAYRGDRYLRCAREFLRLADPNRVPTQFRTYIERLVPAPSQRELTRLASMVKLSMIEIGGATAVARGVIDQFVRERSGS